MLKKILLGGVGILGALVAVFVVVVETRPATMHVERSITIDAPADVIYPRLADFHQWAQWSPWEKLDPNMARTFDGPTSGKGAMYSWKGNSDAGEGKMTITDADAPNRAVIALDFQAPMKATNTVTFTLAPAGNVTKLTWAMDGDCGFMQKAASLVIDMDKMIGPDFEHGLADLKTASEADEKQREVTAAAAATASATPDATSPVDATPPKP